MKLFSFEKPIAFKNGEIVFNDLAYNHPYKKVGDKLIIEGFDAETQQNYKVFYTLNGEVEFVILQGYFNERIRPSWKQEYYVYKIQKIRANGDIFLKKDSYKTLENGEKQLVKRTFFMRCNAKEGLRKFSLQDDGKWSSEGHISAEMRLTWLQK